MANQELKNTERKLNKNLSANSINVSHDGHRDRMRARVANNGIESLADHEKLEFLLFGFIPRKDTNEIAHLLINTFGNFASVLDADIERLASVVGMTYNAAVFLNSLPGVSRKYFIAKSKGSTTLNSRNQLNEYIYYKLSSLTYEEIHLLCKDSSGKLIADDIISKGTINQASLFVRDVLDSALKHKAVSVILVHNHPSHIAKPSQYDRDITSRIALTFAAAEIRFDDHIIIGGDSSYSFRESGEMDVFANGGLNVTFTNNTLSDIKY